MQGSFHSLLSVTIASARDCVALLVLKFGVADVSSGKKCNKRCKQKSLRARPVLRSCGTEFFRACISSVCFRVHGEQKMVISAKNLASINLRLAKDLIVTGLIDDEPQSILVFFLQIRSGGSLAIALACVFSTVATP